MTRFKIGIIDKFDSLNFSNEFNSDGYWEGYGAQVYGALLNIHNEKDLADYVYKFNAENFNYFDEDVRVDLYSESLTCTNIDDYINKFFSDYLYIKNCSNKEYTFTDIKNNNYTILPDERFVLNFGELIKKDKI